MYFSIQLSSLQLLTNNPKILKFSLSHFHFFDSDLFLLLVSAFISQLRAHFVSGTAIGRTLSGNEASYLKGLESMYRWCRFGFRGVIGMVIKGDCSFKLWIIVEVWGVYEV